MSPEFSGTYLSVRTESNSELCSYLMTMENEKLLGSNLYLKLEKDLSGGEVPPDHLPAAIKSENGAYSLILRTRKGIKRIADPKAIGVEVEALDALFEGNHLQGKVFLHWDDSMLEAITTKGGHNRFWGDNTQDPWSFLILDPNRIAALINTLRKPYDPLMLQEAWEKKLTLVETCRGDFKDLKQVVIGTGDEIEGLQKMWCIDYCTAHGMSLKESRE